MPILGESSQFARPIEILLVEDDDDDVRLTKKALESDRIHNHVHRVEDGIEALDFLRNAKPFEAAPLPDLILLDLNMPRMDGRELLKKIKDDESLSLIPVVVLTTSDNESDIATSYKYRANSYVTKPVGLDNYRNVVSAVQEYWSTIAKLPSENPLN